MSYFLIVLWKHDSWHEFVSAWWWLEKSHFLIVVSNNDSLKNLVSMWLNRKSSYLVIVLLRNESCNAFGSILVNEKKWISWTSSKNDSWIGLSVQVGECRNFFLNSFKEMILDVIVFSHVGGMSSHFLILNFTM